MLFRSTSSAVKVDNPEVRRARSLSVPVIPRAEMLAELMRLKHGIAVAGSHGKTTTTSLVVRMLTESGRRPNFIVGADMHDEGTGASWNGADVMVVEADESDGTHLRLPLQGTILTNIDGDHLDHYGSFEGIVAGFEAYLRGIDGPLVVCADDPVISQFVQRNPGRQWVTYGSSDDAM